MMVTFAFPLYFKNVICGGESYGDALWGAAISISMLLVAVVSPVLGASGRLFREAQAVSFLFYPPFGSGHGSALLCGSW